jgi:hypothetical protein
MSEWYRSLVADFGKNINKNIFMGIKKLNKENTEASFIIYRNICNVA